MTASTGDSSDNRDLADPAPEAMGRPDQRLYIRRRGRMTRGQARALEQQYAGFCRPVSDQPLDTSDWFGRQAPLALEIGFGMGQALLAQAEARPDWNWLGIEIYLPGIGSALSGLTQRGLSNVRILDGDARQALTAMLAPQSLSQVSIFFPDPWPKARHHKRRLIQPDFAALLATRLQPGGRLLLATDWAPYAEHMLAVLQDEPALRNTAPAGSFAPRPAQRPETNFERRGLRLGHEVFDLIYERA